jgi:hypothetical protein
MNKHIYIPSGEPNSINELTKKALEDPDLYSMVIFDMGKDICINVIINLEKYAGERAALSFSKKIIKNLLD